MSPTRLPRTLPPPPLPFDHPSQRLTAGRATEPLAGASFRGCEVFFTPRTIAAKKPGTVGWALTLGRLDLALTWRVRLCEIGILGLSRSPALGAATPVSPTLIPAFLLTVARPPILPAGLSPPPSPRRRATLGTAIPGLRVCRSKELFTPLEQTPSLPRPTRPLTSPRFVASWIRAQGSCALPTAKPRARSPLCSASRRLS